MNAPPTQDKTNLRAGLAAGYETASDRQSQSHTVTKTTVETIETKSETVKSSSRQKITLLVSLTITALGVATAVFFMKERPEQLPASEEQASSASTPYNEASIVDQIRSESSQGNSGRVAELFTKLRSPPEQTSTYTLYADIALAMVRTDQTTKASQVLSDLEQWLKDASPNAKASTREGLNRLAREASSPQIAEQANRIIASLSPSPSCTAGSCATGICFAGKCVACNRSPHDSAWKQTSLKAPAHEQGRESEDLLSDSASRTFTAPSNIPQPTLVLRQNQELERIDLRDLVPGLSGMQVVHRNSGFLSTKSLDHFVAWGFSLKCDGRKTSPRQGNLRCPLKDGRHRVKVSFHRSTELQSAPRELFADDEQGRARLKKQRYVGMPIGTNIGVQYQWVCSP
ncbi:MAG: hypothetical protein AAF799_00780 [Myxococcota bacterium]